MEVTAPPPSGPEGLLCPASSPRLPVAPELEQQPSMLSHSLDCNGHSSHKLPWDHP